MYSIFNTVAVVVLWVVMIDVLFFLLWGFSGQTPVDSFYMGSFTAHLLSFAL